MARPGIVHARDMKRQTQRRYERARDVMRVLMEREAKQVMYQTVVQQGLLEEIEDCARDLMDACYQLRLARDEVTSLEET